MTATAPIPIATTAGHEAGGRAAAAEPVTIDRVGDQRPRSAWAAYVQQSPAGSLFHDPLWADTVEHVFGHGGRHLLARRAGQVVGVLPLVEVRSLLGGTMLISMPYGTYGGILCDDEQARDALAEQAVRLVAECGARVLDIRSPRALVPRWETVERYDAFVRALPASVEELDAFLPKRARAAARQARDRENITVQHDPHLLRIVWELYARSMRRLGSINYPYRFFAELVQRLGPRAWVSVAWHRRRAVAGTVSLVYRDTIMPYILGLDERLPCPGAANGLYYCVMERAIQDGLRYFDYGRTRKDNPGSAGFKKNQGFKPQTLGYQRYVPPGQQAPELTPSNRRFALARQVWRRLPLPIARWLGGWLAKSIPG
jgi:FemAB-related protein (PEP-CTERM system-associated)